MERLSVPCSNYFTSSGCRDSPERKHPLLKAEAQLSQRCTPVPRGDFPGRNIMLKRMKILAVVLTLLVVQLTAEPIKLHPDNPHYFSFNGQPILLITSAEHYGAVVNKDFDYLTYFDAL